MAVSSPARADDASAWDGDKRSAVRLIAGAQSRTGDATMHRAGVEMRIAPGWKTYWRYPGDSGVPPHFDFSKSENVKSVSVRWPAPQRLSDDSGTVIGYKHDVIFPLDVVPQDANKPVVLSLSVEYGVCEKICLLADGKADLTVTGKPGEHDDRLKASEALVPVPARIGGDGPRAIVAAKREGNRILVDVAVSGGTVDLFAEGPTADWALPVPSRVAGAPAGQQRFAFELDGLPPGAKPDGATLTLTAVAGERAIEAPYRLD